MPLVRSGAHAAEARERAHRTILEAAEGIVAAGGRYSEASVVEIAKAAGFSRPTFYAYFTDKRALALAVADHAELAIRAEVDDWLTGASDSSVDATVQRLCRMAERERGTLLLFAEAASYDEVVGERWRMLHAGFESQVVALMTSVGGVDPDVASARAFTLIWSTQATLTESLSRAERIPAGIADALALLWTSALGAAAR